MQPPAEIAHKGFKPIPAISSNLPAVVPPPAERANKAFKPIPAISPNLPAVVPPPAEVNKAFKPIPAISPSLPAVVPPSPQPTESVEVITIDGDSDSLKKNANHNSGLKTLKVKEASNCDTSTNTNIMPSSNNRSTPSKKSPGKPEPTVDATGVVKTADEVVNPAIAGEPPARAKDEPAAPPKMKVNLATATGGVKKAGRLDSYFEFEHRKLELNSDITGNQTLPGVNRKKFSGTRV